MKTSVSSNDKPSELYKDGLQRQRFLPAIALIENKLKVIELAGTTDYRFQLLPLERGGI